jgi:hypothetical protein
MAMQQPNRTCHVLPTLPSPTCCCKAALPNCCSHHPPQLSSKPSCTHSTPLKRHLPKPTCCCRSAELQFPLKLSSDLQIIIHSRSLIQLPELGCQVRPTPPVEPTCCRKAAVSGWQCQVITRSCQATQLPKPSCPCPPAPAVKTHLLLQSCSFRWVMSSHQS